MKKIIAALVISIFFVSGIASADFTDVNGLNPHFAAIDSLVGQEILVGYEDGTFRPDQEVTRAEAVKIILLSMGYEVDENSIAGLLFSDVSEDDWFFGYVSTAVSLGIINGYEDGTFLPHQTVNRAEALKILSLAADVVVESPDFGPFVDVDAGAWFAGYADYAKTWNIEPPQVDGRWHPEEEMTRANISELVYRMQNVQDTDNAFDESLHWLRQTFSTVDVSLKIPFGWNFKTEGVGATWIADAEHEQMTLLTPYENGGTLLMTRYSNPDGLSAGQMFGNLEAALPYETKRSVVNGYSALIVDRDEALNYKDWYIYMDNGTLVHFAALRGGGFYSSYLEKYIDLILDSVVYVSNSEDDMTIDEKVEALRTAIQVDGIGESMMALIDDWSLIETDAIGVGTGPVDYFYSPSANITIKYERFYDVILNLRDGETTAF